MATEKKNKIGSLWVKKTRDGKSFLSGSIEVGEQKIRIVIWPNDFKYSEKSPDFKVYIDTYKSPREGNQEDDPDEGPFHSRGIKEPPDFVPSDDDVPF